MASWNLELETDNSIILPTFNFSLAKVQYSEHGFLLIMEDVVASRDMRIFL